MTEIKRRRRKIKRKIVQRTRLRPARVQQTRSGRLYINLHGSRKYYPKGSELFEIVKLILNAFKKKKTQTRKRVPKTKETKIYPKIDHPYSGYSFTGDQLSKFEDKIEKKLEQNMLAIEYLKQEPDKPASLEQIQQITEAQGRFLTATEMREIQDKINEEYRQRDRKINDLSKNIIELQRQEAELNQKIKQSKIDEKKANKKGKEDERARLLQERMQILRQEARAKFMGERTSAQMKKLYSEIREGLGLQKIKSVKNEHVFKVLQENNLMHLLDAEYHWDQYLQDYIAANLQGMDRIPDDEPGAPAEIEGQGITNKDGLSDNQINEMMSHYKDYVGTYASNEMRQIPIKPRMAFIINTKPRSVGLGHWVACYIDTLNDMSVEYYDSFGADPSKEFLKGLKIIIDKLKPSSYLKLKINRIKEQKINSSDCGYHCLKFIIDRFRGIPFKDCTGYSNYAKGIKDVKAVKAKFSKFDFV